MNHNNNRNNNEHDNSGEIASWVIIFILMFVFPPAGLIMLILKLRSYAKPSKTQQKRSGAHYSDSSGQSRDRFNTTANRTVHNAASTAHRAVDRASGVADQVSQVSGTAGAAINQASEAAQRAIYQASEAAQQAINEVTGQKPGRNQQNTSKNTASSHQTAPKNYNTYSAAENSAMKSYSAKKKQSTSQQSSYNYGNYADKSKGASKSKDGKQLKSKSAVAIPIILLLTAIALFVLGATTMIGAAVDIWGAGLARWPAFWMGAFYFSGGFISLISKSIFTKRFSRYRNYYAYIADRDVIPLADIAQTAGVSVKTVRRDIQTMINSEYFEPGSYIDNELESLVLCGDAANEIRKSTGSSFDDDIKENSEITPNQYMTIMAELREMRLMIADLTISGKIERIEEITAKIFRIVEEHPDKKNQIRRFESYYLPTTMKLVRSYSTLEKQGVKGENIMSAKENIGQVLDTLATGYEQQLDQLFMSDAMDIAADITVLENLMHQDGLKGDNPDFKTMTG